MTFYSVCLALLMLQANALSFSPQSRFTGNKVHHDTTVHSTSITMRKQKASDKRTSRMQKNHDTESFTDTIALRTGTSPLTPMSTGQWKHKTVVVMNQLESTGRLGGRGRSRKRSAVYSNLASYHGQFLELLTKEFLAEVSFSITKNTDEYSRNSGSCSVFCSARQKQ
jgi:hypothetical protein